MTSSADSLRSLLGLSEMKTKPPLVWPPPWEPPPVNPTTVSTAGSACTSFTNSRSFFSMAWKEIDWSAWMPPVRRPVSCCGKKPLGMSQ
jgi:hypothetical protein